MTHAEGNSLPELVLPPPTEVKPPKYSYEQYEQEERSWRKGKRKWQDEQRRRWVEGHAGLTGIHYFYLTQIRIKHRGGLIRPIWRDVDEMVFEDYLDCKQNDIDEYVFKRRGFGLSTIYGGAIPIYIFVTNAGATCLMTSADLGRVSDLKNEKFISQLNSLEEWVGLKLKKNDDAKGVIEIRHFDADGEEIKGVISHMLCRQTSQDKKDVGKFEGARAAYAFLDELFLHPYPEEVRTQTESCLMDDQVRWGIMVSGGSAGLGNRLGMKEGKKIWDKSKTGLVRGLFISGALGISAATIRDTKGKKIGEENFCINGWSDVARAEAYINWQRSILEASPDKKEITSFIKRYPLNIDEVFISDIVGAIPKEIAEMIPERLRNLETEIPNIRRMRIKRDDNGKASLVPDPNGPFHMLENPVRGARYIMGTDPIPMVETANEATEVNDANGSMFCSVIKDIDRQKYIGIYMKRSKHIGPIYSDVTGLQEMYNDCKNMIERNRGEVLHTHYRLNNNLEMLAYQPQWIGAKGFKRNTVRGWYKAGNDERAYEATFDYYRMYMDNVDFPQMLEQLQVFGLPNENCDIIDAVISCEVYHKGLAINDGAMAKMAMEARYEEVPYTTIVNGKRVTRYRKSLVNGDEIGYSKNQFGNGHNIF